MKGTFDPGNPGKYGFPSSKSLAMDTGMEKNNDTTLVVSSFRNNSCALLKEKRDMFSPLGCGAFESVFGLRLSAGEDTHCNQCCFAGRGGPQSTSPTHNQLRTSLRHCGIIIIAD